MKTLRLAAWDVRLIHMRFTRESGLRRLLRDASPADNLPVRPCRKTRPMHFQCIEHTFGVPPKDKRRKARKLVVNLQIRKKHIVPYCSILFHIVPYCSILFSKINPEHCATCSTRTEFIEFIEHYSLIVFSVNAIAMSV